jgi:hypothetical protein
MKLAPALFGFALLQIVFAPPSFGEEPKLNVQAICKSRASDARLLRSTPEQSLANCMHDEDAAMGQLTGIWATTSVSMRNRCKADAHSLGTTSYLDLLTCIQMKEELKSGAKKP